MNDLRVFRSFGGCGCGGGVGGQYRDGRVDGGRPPDRCGQTRRAEPWQRGAGRGVGSGGGRLIRLPRGPGESGAVSSWGSPAYRARRKAPWTRTLAAAAIPVSISPERAGPARLPKVLPKPVPREFQTLG